MKKKKNDQSAAPEFSSPPCSMHEVDPVYMGLADSAHPISALSDEELGELGKALISGLPDALIFADREGRIRFWNEGAERIFGFCAAEAIGESLDIIIPERLQQRHWEGYDRMMTKGQSSHGAEEMLAVPAVNKAGQKLSIQFTVAAVRDVDGSLTGIAALLRDVTATFEQIRQLKGR